MKRFIAAMVAALLLVGLLAGAVSAQPQGTVSLSSATVNKAGQVTLVVNIVCPPTMFLGVNGQVTQSIGHKTLLQGSLNGAGWECAAAGTTQIWLGTSAYNGTFSATWATINVSFFDLNNCSPNYCPNVAGGQFYMKLTSK